MPEMSCQGWAEVMAIDACPEIESGGGRVVTGTFAHTHGYVLDVQVEGVAKPLGATAQHPFWSEDRQDYVPVGELRQGERLRTLHGLAQVREITARGPPQAVYNIEVAIDHTYLVGEDGVLVHNASACKAARDYQMTNTCHIQRDSTMSHSRNQHKTPVPARHGRCADLKSQGFGSPGRLGAQRPQALRAST